MPAACRGVAFCLAVALSSSASADSERGPPIQRVHFSLLTRGRRSIALWSAKCECRTLGGWQVDPPAMSRPSSRSTALNADARRHSRHGRARNFRESVSGSIVRLDWDRVLEVVISHQVEAGSPPGS